jgi:hypothetical protein
MRYIYLQMDPQEDPLKTRPIQKGKEMSIEPYPNQQFGLNDDPDHAFGDRSLPTRTRTRSDGPEPFLILSTAQSSLLSFGVSKSLFQFSQSSVSEMLSGVLSSLLSTA